MRRNRIIFEGFMKMICLRGFCLFALPVVLLVTGFGMLDRELNDQVYRNLDNQSFGQGERLEYKLHLGFLNVGYGVMEISPTIYQINNRPCYRTDIYGETIGMWRIFYKVKDNWGSYIDTASIVPQRFYRYIVENRYRKNEIVDFSHRTDTAIVNKLDGETRELKEQQFFSIPNNSQDLVSGYYWLRTLDYDTIEVGSTIKVDAFFDDEVFDFVVTYLGKDVIKTKLGKVNALVLSPKMPDNKIFSGEDAIKVYLSDDKSKIPLKIHAAMFVGAVEIDIIKADNLRNSINYSD